MNDRTTPRLLEGLSQCIDEKLFPEEFVLCALFILSGERNSKSQWVQISGQPGNDCQFENSFLQTQDFKNYLINSLSNEIFESRFSFFFRKKGLRQFFFDTLASSRWKDIPASSLESLRQWKKKNYNLILCDYQPEPFHLLEMQAQGLRCVTVFRKDEEIKLIHEHNRDSFLFTVHDLEHAHRFFSCPKNFALQKQLAGKYLQAFRDGPWKDFWSPSAMGLFNYLISDMNTHPQHSLQTLQSLWIQEWKLRTRTPLEERLSGPDEIAMNQSWQEFTRWIQVSRPTCESEARSTSLP